MPSCGETGNASIRRQQPEGGTARKGDDLAHRIKCPSTSESEESERSRTMPCFRGGQPVRKMAPEREEVVMLNTFITSGRSSVPHDFNTSTTWETAR